ncbi:MULTISPECIES: hypothetical protein [unclassified Haladaptatus]|uniref:DUF7109 family protein n=1 Tax=unclassified Haladaptatus TaxID=2622732 RepID=UPI00209C025C|nr:MULTISPECIES: hypothetical protein [unclassified Haladaptatus]MCO8246576.1 hypothetical protein [Haladaptatus sp. AB643]MCO8256303.1 hypothetical protein [Haladaptatus sp. AB618]
MSETKDELAGVVDLFGALTRAELAEALAELAFKQGKEVDESAFESVIEDGVRDFYLVEARADTDTGETVLVPGPVAFPALPDNAEDLPHIMDVPERTTDREGLGERVKERLAAEAETADEERAQYLVDVSYDLEAWAPVEAGNVRDRLDES